MPPHVVSTRLDKLAGVTPRHPSDAAASVPADADFQVTVAEPPDAEPGADLVLPAQAASAADKPIEQLATIGHIGRYALKYRLGEGGLGTVYAAFDPLLSRGIALKTLHLDADGDDRETLSAMLLNEARAAAALSHPFIVTVHDAGRSDEGVYLAMEHLRGRDLRHLLADGWRPTVRQAVQIVRRVAEALAYAHHKGVVHCDIKPANIFMVSRTGPKVLDFGIARVAQRPEANAAQAIAAGSPYYMAPEQLRGDAAVDRRCDVYSLGVVLYELLAGQRAFAGASLDEIAAAVRERTPRPPHEVNPRVPASLSALVARAMAKHPADRLRSARQFARELRDWLDAHNEDAPIAVVSRSRLPWALTAGAGALFAVAALAWQAGFQAHSAPPAAAAAPAQEVAAATPAPDVAPLAIAPVMALAAPAPSGAAAQEVPAAAVVLAGAAAPPKKAASAARPAPRRAPARNAAAPAAPAAKGQLNLAVSPWGQIEIDGAPAGTTPPLSRLQLTEGRHTVVIRNEDFPPYTTTVNVTADQPVTVKHRFGP